MIDTQEIEVQRTEHSRLSEINFKNLPFGKVFSDHALIAKYTNGEWQAPKIIPYGDIHLSPATSALHYGQAVFEGMKAFKNPDGEILVFRPEKNHERINRSAERLCMPKITEHIFIEGIKQLVSLDRNWVPNEPDSSMYIRPFMIGTDPFLGVKPSDDYLFMIITSPVGPYYSKPLHLKVETEFTRAAKGGVGFAKAAGNYASAMLPAKKAQKQGIDQLIWTDAKEHKYLEEAGTMNMMAVIDGKLITPPTGSTILAGVTRECFLILSREAGYIVEERPIAIEELISVARSGKLEELFGVGTAATTAHVAKLSYEDETFELPPIESRKISNQIGNQLIGIKMDTVEDVHNWNMKF